MSVLLVAAGLFYTDRANRHQQALAVEQQNLAVQGQIADRFTAAIDQLGQEDEKGASRLSIRLGGIFALQRIMTDAPGYEPSTVAVLTAFVNTHSARPVPHRTTGNVPPAALDVRDAFIVLATRPRPAPPLDLGADSLNVSQIDVPGAALANTLLGGDDLSWTGLRAADLDHAHLDGADLTGADLRGAVLTGVFLEGAFLLNARLSGADLSGAQAPDADMQNAHLDQVNLTGAELARASLRGADLTGANFDRADLSSAKLDNADLSRADLTTARVAGASFAGARMIGTRMTRSEYAIVTGQSALVIDPQILG